MPTQPDPFDARSELTVDGRTYAYHRLAALTDRGVGHVDRLPYSIRILLEATLRHLDGVSVTADDIAGLASWNAVSVNRVEIPFIPARVVLQDFTGVPAVVDLAAMRDAIKSLGGDPEQINPESPCDLVIDHSVQVDEYATRVALMVNAQKEFQRNNERYRFLKWGRESLSNFRVVPPATGIVHQVNLEYLARVVWTSDGSAPTAYPDSLVGTDSNTTMINGLGVLGWGVGGIEAEAVMLGQPVYMRTPEVVGVRLTGSLPEGTTSTDLVLTITQTLRALGVVDKFVEFTGPGLGELAIPDRATIANMAPEYGATMGFFPVDERTLDYLRLTSRDEHQIALVEAYCKANGLFRSPDAPEPVFTDIVELDLSTIVPSLAGPKRPQDRIELTNMQTQWRTDLVQTFGRSGEPGEGVEVEMDGQRFALSNGSVVIAAITSCTNTSNPDVMIAAGLVAKKAHALGLKARPWVKTSLAPGSKVVTEYFDTAGLSEDLDAIGFYTVGYGCTTCIGNSGPLPEPIAEAITRTDLVAAAVISGNRNFEGRVHPLVRANYLASPPLVVAYAIAGTVDLDPYTDPLATTPDGRDVFLKDIWPTNEEVRRVRAACITPAQFADKYAHVFTENQTWNDVPVSSSESYRWDEDSTYIRNPPFFEGMTRQAPGLGSIRGARALCLLGDSVTTDHISPAGAIATDSPAGDYLQSRGVPISAFNSYGSRRGNHEVMMRGTFANVRVRNQLAASQRPEPGTDATPTIPEGGWTRDFTQVDPGDDPWSAPVVPIYDAAMNAKAAGVPLIILAGRDYGMGSSRDWAAKGPLLLGVRAAIAQSFERIHRSNLVFMGIVPLELPEGQSAASLGLDGTETFDIDLPETIEPQMPITVRARKTGVSGAAHSGAGVPPASIAGTALGGAGVPPVGIPSGAGVPPASDIHFTCTCRIDTPIEVDYVRNGGILQTVIRKKLNAAHPAPTP